MASALTLVLPATAALVLGAALVASRAIGAMAKARLDQEISAERGRLVKEHRGTLRSWPCGCAYDPAHGSRSAPATTSSKASV